SPADLAALGAKVRKQMEMRRKLEKLSLDDLLLMKEIIRQMAEERSKQAATAKAVEKALTKMGSGEVMALQEQVDNRGVEKKELQKLLTNIAPLYRQVIKAVLQAREHNKARSNGNVPETLVHVPVLQNGGATLTQVERVPEYARMIKALEGALQVKI